MKKVAVYPGSFDPVTNGHVDIIQRALKIFDKLIVLVAYNPDKKSLFTVEERMAIIKDVIGNKNLAVDCYTGLLVDYVRKSEANIVIRGMRALSDFENEFQMALMNRNLNRDMEIVFLMTDYRWLYTSSRLIKEVAGLGGDVNGLVPELVYRKLQEKYAADKKETSKRKRS
ncbi:MAG: pantetheine-phosphate adenylyltransferase [Deltaproteobacteria bacterium]|nr:pantetheine-phosphate adenylyltransferase [Deltaproteobacteria bacterium]